MNSQDDLKAIETFTLGEKDRDLFFSALNAPPEPNAALKALMMGSKG